MERAETPQKYKQGRLSDIKGCISHEKSLPYVIGNMFTQQQDLPSPSERPGWWGQEVHVELRQGFPR